MRVQYIIQRPHILKLNNGTHNNNIIIPTYHHATFVVVILLPTYLTKHERQTKRVNKYKAILCVYIYSIALLRLLPEIYNVPPPVIIGNILKRITVSIMTLTPYLGIINISINNKICIPLECLKLRIPFNQGFFDAMHSNKPFIQGNSGANDTKKRFCNSSK